LFFVKGHPRRHRLSVRSKFWSRLL
jgi:hypothetical protein